MIIEQNLTICSANCCGNASVSEGAGALPHGRNPANKSLAMRRRTKVVAVFRVASDILQSVGANRDGQRLQSFRFCFPAAFSTHHAEHVILERQFLRDVLGNEMNFDRGGGDRKTRRCGGGCIISSAPLLGNALCLCASVANLVRISFKDWPRDL